MGSSASSYQVIRGGDPVGTIIAWPTETPPVGYLECNGASLVRTDYAELFAVIGTMYGTVDGTHFNLPDYRGRFLRSWGHGETDDPDRATRTKPTATGATITDGDYVGTEQDHVLESHRHRVGNVFNSSNYSVQGTIPAGDAGSGNYYDEYTGGNETRPLNTAVMYCIKYTYIPYGSDLLRGVDPVGTVIAWATSNAPAGYLHCNGASVLRTDYPELFNVIGTLYGAADATHFNLPDYRGRFLRAWADGQSDDPDRASRTKPAATGATISNGDYVGTEQADQFKTHQHTIDQIGQGTAWNAPYYGLVYQYSNGTNYYAAGGYTNYTGATNQTHPMNTSVMYCIKYTLGAYHSDTVVKETLMGAYRNLVAVQSGNTSVDVNIDEIILQDVNGNCFRHTSVDLTIDITSTGINGLDTGSEANSTWYHIWIISNGTSVSGLLSTSSTSPTLPSGYTYKGLVSAVYNNSSGNFNPFKQIDKMVVINQTNAMSGGTATTITGIGIQVIVPPTAKKICGTLYAQEEADGCFVYLASSNNSDYYGKIYNHIAIATSTYSLIVTPYTIPLLVSQTIYYYVSPGSNTTISITGWEY